MTEQPLHRRRTSRRSRALHHAGLDPISCTLSETATQNISDVSTAARRRCANDHCGWFVATDTDIDFVIVAGPAALPTWLAGRDIYLEELTARSRLA